MSTNSICQGEQALILWPLILNGIEIDFAYTSFKWSNNAKNQAGVTCVIIGMRSKSNAPKYLFEGNVVNKVSTINPYLTISTVLTIFKATTPISEFPTMLQGCASSDDGHYMLSPYERKELMRHYKDIEKIIKPVQGSQEFIRGEERYCIWITDELLDYAKSLPPINKKIRDVYNFRIRSKRANTIKSAETPYKFGEIRYKDSPCIIVPRVSSETRKYIPIGYLNAGTVILDSAFSIYDAPTWLFGVITSLIHMVWVKTVGGRLKTDYRYSAQLCYNTFPFPTISPQKKAEIEAAAENVLVTREFYPDKTLADLYDPDKMPQDLRDAHARLDDIVESCYPGYPFANDEARLECLFKLYEKMTAKK